MFIYRTLIDWYGTMSIDEYFENLKSESEITGSDYKASQDIADATAFLMNAARHAPGWEGDIRNSELHVSVLPSPDDACCCMPLFMWKQDNNGTTFVASPFELSWMDDCEVYRE